MTVPTPERATGEVVELRIPRKAEWVAVARLAVAAVASRMRFTNAIQSADGADQIEILCEADLAHLRVTVANRRGRGAPTAPPPTTEDDVRIDGLGVFLIRSLMDDVEYDADPERGTQLVMVKRLAS